MDHGKVAKGVKPLSPDAFDGIRPGWRINRYIWWLPIIGWIVWSTDFHLRTSAIRQAYLDEVEARPKDTLDFWGEDPNYREFVAEVLNIIGEEMGWDRASFVPEDPFRVVFWSYDDGLDMEWTLMKIEERFLIDLLEDEDSVWLGGSLGYFVDEIYRRKTEQK